eukprot:726493-Prorocentrum_minimum.AAC.1
MGYGRGPGGGREGVWEEVWEGSYLAGATAQGAPARLGRGVDVDEPLAGAAAAPEVPRALKKEPRPEGCHVSAVSAPARYL